MHVCTESGMKHCVCMSVYRLVCVCVCESECVFESKFEESVERKKKLCWVWFTIQRKCGSVVVWPFHCWARTDPTDDTDA